MSPLFMNKIIMLTVNVDVSACQMPLNHSRQSPRMFTALDYGKPRSVTFLSLASCLLANSTANLISENETNPSSLHCDYRDGTSGESDWKVNQ